MLHREATERQVTLTKESDMILEGKIALVIGGTSNIGLATARVMAREGAKVIVSARNADNVRNVASELNGDGFAADLSKPDEIAALYDYIRKQHGRIDAVVNDPGRRSSTNLLDTTLEEWNATFAVNLTGYFLSTQHAARLMIDTDTKGSIVNIGTANNGRAAPGNAAYFISKQAVTLLSRQSAMDLAPYGIRVNTVLSGNIRAADGRNYPMIPMGRIGQPEEIAETIAFLASDRASYITNTEFAVDGGRINFYGPPTGTGATPAVAPA
jgi:NAD(P)-dependent dehydrogenase (short-subunit alcohol dehydrogenase family)